MCKESPIVITHIIGMLTFHSFEKLSFRYENDDKKTITKRSFLRTFVLKNIVFIKLIVSLDNR